MASVLVRLYMCTGDPRLGAGILLSEASEHVRLGFPALPPGDWRCARTSAVMASKTSGPCAPFPQIARCEASLVPSCRPSHFKVFQSPRLSLTPIPSLRPSVRRDARRVIRFQPCRRGRLGQRCCSARKEVCDSILISLSGIVHMFLRVRATVCNGHAELCNRSYGNTTFLGGANHSQAAYL